ncbi:hypothetical protein Acid7E03_02330 [Acidisoma sp. 7E03]
MAVHFLQAGIDPDEAVAVPIAGGGTDEYSVDLDDVGLFHRSLLAKSEAARGSLFWAATVSWALMELGGAGKKTICDQ